MAMLRAKAPFKGTDWLRQKLCSYRAVQLRELAQIAGVQNCRGSNGKWLTSAELVEQVIETLLSSTSVGRQGTAEQLKAEALAQGSSARSWLRKRLNTFSAKPQAKESSRRVRWPSWELKLASRSVQEGFDRAHDRNHAPAGWTEQ